MNHKMFISSVGLAVASIALFTGCSKEPAEEAAATKAKTKLVVGHDIWVGYSGVFLAKELGYFGEADLEVDLKPFSNPGDTLPALVSSTLDIGLATLQNVALLRGNSNAEVVAVGLLDSSNGADAVIAKQGINSISDLKGKTVATTLGEVNHFLLLIALKKAGLSPTDVKITSMSADDAGAAFLAGKVDAAVTWEPWVTKAKTNGGNILFTSAEVPDTIMDAIVVRKADVTAKKDSLIRFRDAIDRGVKFLREKPDEAHVIIGKYLDAPPADVKGMLEGDKIYSLEDNKRMFGTADAPGPVYASMKSVIEFAKESDLIKTAPDTNSMFDPSLVR